jgi:hypothetical protein
MKGELRNDWHEEGDQTRQQETQAKEDHHQRPGCKEDETHQRGWPPLAMLGSHHWMRANQAGLTEKAIRCQTVASPLNAPVGESNN